ncbi:hypothetical protein Tsubulata_040746 [Turnera subulata]|uniref:Formin-like protein n=1 Tax=Turnera subulata TaxID=218843 RepID=A0A9Q0FXH9_9ROSI|nr:hypothetical protein Tsubulata_040746 [Turnera subulata]
MGGSSQILLMIFIIILSVLISLQSTHIVIANASLDAADGFKNHGLQKLHIMKEHEDGNEQRIEKVSGEDDGNETPILKKFRALLGLKSFRGRGHSSRHVSPAPAPSLDNEAEVPAPAPAPLPIHVHPHHPFHHTEKIPPRHLIREGHGDKGRHRKILAAVLVSSGVAFIVLVLGIIWASGKLRQHRKGSAGIMTMYRKKGRTRSKSKYASAKRSASKVSLNPGLDLLYLDSLERDLEQQSAHHKKPTEIVNTSSNHSTPKHELHDRKEANQEVLVRQESGNASSSSTREIMSVHEEEESVKYDSDGANSSSSDKIIPIECHSSDDESFHSFVDSHSSNVRLSNASAGTLSDTSEISPLNVQKTLTSPTSPCTNLDIPQATAHHTSTPDLNLGPNHPHSPDNSGGKDLTVSSPSAQDNSVVAPPTPPPPPPPPPPRPPSNSALAPRMCLIPSLGTSLSAKVASKASGSTILSNLSSPRMSASSSGSNATPENDVASSTPKSPKQAPSGIPPPPCPPPFLKGNGNSAKGPPPPPSLLPQHTPLGKDGVPLPKLKPLHWDKVRAAPDQSMVWDKIRSNSFELDEEMIESLFGYNLRGTIRNDEGKSKSPSPSKHVLDSKRLQNITILSKALNATPEQVCDALLRGNGLCSQQLEALVKMAPTKEEESKLSGYKGDINELVSAERFVKVLLSIPFSFVRVEAMLYKETFEDEVVHLRTSFSMLDEACKELRSSRLFLKLLEAVLKTGNRMNVGTIRGGARAFKLDALLKLADVKGTDGKTTLLHFVVQEIIRSEGIRVSDSIMGKINQKNRSKTLEEKEEDYRRMGLDLVSGLSTELYNVKKTATIDMDVLASSVSNLSDGMARIKHLIQKDLSMDEKSSNFVHTMSTFLNYAEKQLKQLQEDEDRVLSHVRGITEYFHGNVSKDEPNPLRIFVIVRDFLGMLDHVCKELRSLKVPSSPSPLAPFR